MTGASNLLPEQLDDVGIHDLISFLVSMGYSTEALSNEEIRDMVVSVLDGHSEEGGDPEDLDFSMDFKGDAYSDVR